MLGLATKLDSDVAAKINPESINQSLWEILDPSIQTAIENNDLAALRGIESEIRVLTQNLIQYGLYRVQRNSIRIANETGQAKTVRENIREASYEDIMFARSMNGEAVLEFAETVWQVIRKWLLAKGIPEDIMQLVNDLSCLSHGGMLLMNKQELSEWDADDLITSFRRSSILLHARKAKEAANGKISFS